jgi:hypothetical protein
MSRGISDLVTRQQKELSNFILDYYFRHEKVPSYNIICKEMDWRRSNAIFHCKKLYEQKWLKANWVRKGLLHRKHGYKLGKHLSEMLQHGDRFQL